MMTKEIYLEWLKSIYSKLKENEIYTLFLPGGQSLIGGGRAIQKLIKKIENGV